MALLWSAGAAAYDVGHVTVIEAPAGSYDAETAPGHVNIAPRAEVARRFYRDHADNYDFLVVLPVFTADLGSHAAGVNISVSNDVQGIGRDPLDLRAAFGSTHLLSYVDLQSLMPASQVGTVNDAVATAVHELAHQWLAYVSFEDGGGAVRTDLLGQGGGHWSFFLSSNASVMYGSAWRDNGDGTYTSLASRKRYSPLDLYLMGFLGPEQVPAMTLLHPAPGTPYQATDIPPPDGTVIRATPETVTIGEIVAAMGARSPAATASPLRAAFVVLVPPGGTASAEQLEFAEAVRAATARSFFLMTAGQGVLETDLSSTPVASNPDISRALEFLLSGQKPDGSWADQEETVVRDTASAVQALTLVAGDARAAAAIGRAIAFLRALAPANTDDAARRAIGLATQGSGTGWPDAWPRALDSASAYAYADGYGATVLDTVLAVTARLDSGTAWTALSAETLWLVDRQAADGGWPFTLGGPSRAEATGRVLQLLGRLPRTAVPSSVVTRAFAFLASRRFADGTYGDDFGSAGATAEAVLGLLAWGNIDGRAAGQAASALLALQGPDGSVAGSVHQTAELLRVLRTTSYPNLSISTADVLVSSVAVTQGEAATVVLTVHNQGLAAASSVEVAVLDSNGAALAPGQIVPELGPGEAVTLTFALSTADHGGTEQLFVFVDPSSQIEETREDDNRVAVPFAVTEPPLLADLEVARPLGVTPLAIASLPAALTISAQIGNRGSTGALGVPVLALVQGQVVGIQYVDLPPRSTRQVSFAASVTAASGPVAIQITVDPEGQVVQARRDNDSAWATIPLLPFVDIAVASVGVFPTQAEEGQPIEIAYRVENPGTVEVASGSLTVNVRNATGAMEATLAQQAISLPAGGHVLGSVTWRPHKPGPRTIEVIAQASDDVNASNDRRTAPLEVNSSALTNLAFEQPLHVSPNPALQGHPVTVSGTVVNDGHAAAAMFAIDVYRGDANGVVHVSRQDVPILQPGETVRVAATFDAPNAEPFDVLVRIDADDAVAEFDESDNEATVHLTPLSLPDLALEDLAAAPVLLDQGGTTTVSFTVRNAGNQDSPEASVEIFAGDPDAGGTILFSGRVPALRAGASITVSYQWTPVGVAGLQSVVAVVNRDGAFVEGDLDNNRAAHDVMVQAGLLSLSYPFFSPNGDGVQDTTELFYRLKAAALLVVRIADARGKAVRTLAAEAAASGSVTWDGRDERGRLVPDGTYRLAAFVEGSALGSISAVVDTNRTPLHVTEPELISYDRFPGITQDYSYSGALLALPDDTGLVYLTSSDFAAGSSCTFMLQPLDGSAARPFGPSWDCTNEWRTKPSLSPDGTKIAYAVEFDGEPSCSTYYGCTGLRVYDIATGALSTLLLDGYDVGTQVDDEFPPVWSPDGQRLLFMSTRAAWNSEQPFGVEVIGVDGQDRQLLRRQLRRSEDPDARCVSMGEGLWCETLTDYFFSPDGQTIGVGYSLGKVELRNGDGSWRQLWSSGPLPEWEEHLFIQASGFGDTAWSPDGTRISVLDPVDYGYRVLDAVTGGVLASGLTGRSAANRPVSRLMAPRDADVIALLRAEPDPDDRYADRGSKLWSSGPAGAEPTALLDLGKIGFDSQTFAYTPGGTAVTFRGGGSDWEYRAVVSLANLGLRMSANRVAGAAAVRLKGTVADANLAGWELSARAVTGGPATTLARGTAPVVSDLFSEWVPPGPGLYEVTLRAGDKAGNARSRSIRVNYTSDPIVQNLSADPVYISPNGDGIQDESTVAYTVNDAVPVEFDVLDSGSNSIDRITREHPLAGSYTFAWSGSVSGVGVLRDDAYALQVDGTTLRIVVDSTRPGVEVVLGMRNELGFRDPEKVFFPWEQRAFAFDGDGEREVRLPQLFAVRGERATDGNMKEWAVEESSYAAPGHFERLYGGCGCYTNSQYDDRLFDTYVPIDLARGRNWRVSATDKAGNSARTPVISPPEKLFVLAVGDASALDPANGYVRLEDGQLLPRVDLLNPLFSRDGYLPDPPFEPKRLTFWLATTIGPRLVRYGIRYTGFQEEEDWDHVVAQSEMLVTWDASRLPVLDYEVTVLAIDEEGQIHESEPLQLRRVPTMLFDVCENLTPDREVLRVAFGVPAGEPPNLANDWIRGGRLQLLKLSPDEDPFEAATYRTDPEADFAFSESAGLSIDRETWTGVDAYDTSGLTSCRYVLRLLERSGRCRAWNPEIRSFVCAVKAIDLCTPYAASRSVSGRDLTLTLAENFRQPVLGVDVLFQDAASPQWNYALTVPGFHRVAAPTHVDLGPAGQCVKHKLRYVAHLADGSVVDTWDHEEFGWCEGPPELASNCTTVTLTEPVRDGTAPFCTAHVPTYSTTVTANSPNGSITDLEAGLLAPRGGAPALASFPAPPRGPRVVQEVLFETSTLQEGEYVAFAEATDLSGEPVRTVLPPEQSIIVDRTPPVSAITSPADGAHLCPVEVRSEQGTLRWEIPVHGRVSDAHLERLAVRLAPHGSTALVTALEKPFNPRQATAIEGELGRIDATDLSAGDYDLQLAAQDVSGGSVCTPLRTFHVSASVQIAGLAADPTLFAPDPEGSPNATAIAFELSEPAEVTLSAVKGGTAVEVASGSFAAGPSTVEWHGTSTAGRALDDGNYTIQVTAADACGHRAEDSTWATIDTTPPVARVDAPAGDPVGAVALVVGEATDLHFDRYVLSIGRGTAPAELTPIANSAHPATGVLGSVATASLEPGVHTIQLEAWDRVGHRSVATSTFQVVPPTLVAQLSVTPPLVSPNGDGVLDAASAEVTLSAPAQVVLELVGTSGAVLGTLFGPVAAGAGPSTVVLGPVELGRFADGDYGVRLTATSGALVEQAVAPLSIDGRPPDIDVLAPARGAWVQGRADVEVKAIDPHLTTWTLGHQSPAGTSVVLASGTTTPIGLQAALRGLADGPHTLQLAADDAAGNRAPQLATTFYSDATPPEVAFVHPRSGDYVSGLQGVLPIQATLVEANPKTVTLERVSASGRQTLYSGDSWPGGGQLALWEVASEQDGSATLILTAEDRAGNVGTAEVAVVVDNTPPIARIDTPRGEFMPASGDFQGTAADANLESYTVEISDGPPEAASRFTIIASGHSSIEGGTLAQLASPPADGQYTVRVTAVDRAGNASSDLAGFKVDSTPPAPPIHLAATVRRPSDAVLTWTASASPDVVGYRVLRATAGGPFASITPSPVPGLTLVDAALPDAKYSYVVVAVDAAGLESAHSNEASVLIDATPPTVVITRPPDGVTVGGIVEVLGAAYGTEDLKEWRLSFGAGASPDAFTLLARSALPVYAGPLASWDVSQLPEGSIQTLRLEAEDLAGNNAETSVTVQVDNAPPAPPVLLSATPAGSDVTVVWRENSEPDLRGYLLYRNGALVNAPDGMSLEDVTPFILPAGVTTWVDHALTDGTYTYQVQAVDRALNVSDPSNTLSVTLDNGPPSAWIVSPEALARVSEPVAVTAETKDLDVASIQLEARAGTDPFAPLGPALTRYPYMGRLDPDDFATPVVEVRAVATDRSGHTDPAPRSVFYFVVHELQPPVASTLVDRQQVSVSWTDPNPPAEVAGYDIERDGWLQVYPASVQGTASATTSRPGREPSRAFDGSWGTSWEAVGAAPQSWTLTFTQPRLIDEVSVDVTHGTTLDVLARVMGIWVPLERGAAVEVGIGLSHALGTPLQVDAVRVDVLASQDGLIGIREVGLTATGVTAASPFVQTGVALGEHEYQVVAVSVFGQRVGGGAPARIYKPLLAALPATLSEPGATLSGSQAASNAQVQIFAAGTAVASVQADASGAFSAPVALALGSNAFTAQATDAAGNRSVFSDPVTTAYDPVPGVSIALSVTGISGSDVSLSFEVTGDVTGVASYEMRRTDTVEHRIAALGPGDRAYVDRGLANGTYSYVVAPCNAHGICGTPSNRVSATVAVPAPVAPHDLVVTAPAGGGALALDWAYEGAVGRGFLVERAGAADGPFAPLNASSPARRPHYLDQGLTNGVTYYYRVFAIDAAGNASAPSNVAWGTPATTEPPPAPRIFAPTVPGQPIVVNDPLTTVKGFSQFGTVVELFQNARSVGTTVVDTIRLRRTPVPTAHPPVGVVVTSPDLTRRAYPYYGAAGNYVIAIEAVATGEVVTVEVPGQWLTKPSFSPDSRHLAIQGYPTVYVVDVGGGNLRALPCAYRSCFTATWSPDSTSLAYTAYVSSSYGSRIVTIGRDGSSARELPAAAGEQWWNEARWVAADALLARVERSGVHSLVQIDPGTGTRRELYRGMYASDTYAVSPDGSEIALAAWIGEGTEIVLVDRATGDARVLTHGGGYYWYLSFAPDGARLASAWNGHLVIHDLETGAATVVDESLGGSLTWAPEPEPLVYEYETRSVSALAWDGYFEFRDLPLAPGDNFFQAVATGSDGLRSQPSESIQVSLDAAQLADLAVEAIVQPAIPVAGDAASAYVTVRNLGGVAATDPQVSVSVIGADGSIRPAPYVTLGGTVEPGGMLRGAVPLDIAGLVGEQQLVAVVDPAQLVPDADRSNNRAVRPFTIAQSALLALTASAIPDTVAARGTSIATVSLANPGAERDVTVRVSLRDALGDLVLDLPPEQSYTPLPSGATPSFTRAIEVGTILPGTYQVVAEASSGGVAIAEARAPLTVTPDRATTLALAPGRATYYTDETIELTATVTNASANTVLSGASYVVELRDPLGTPVFTATAPVATLATGSAARILTSVAPFGATPGTFQAVGRVVLGDDVLATASVAVPLVGRPRLSGSIALTGADGTPPRVPSGEDAVVRYTVANRGGSASAGVTARIAVVDPDSLAVMASATVPMGTLAAGAEQAGDVSFSTAGWPLKVYGLSLSADHDGVQGHLLATASFRVGDASPPMLVIRNLEPGMFVRGDVAPSIEARDDASGVAEVRASVDGAEAVPLALDSGSVLDGLWSTVLLLAPDGPHELVFTAADLEGNDGASDPRADNPVVVTVISDTIPPALAILGVSEGGLYGAPVTPVVEATDVNLASVDARLGGAPFASGSAIARDGDYLLSAYAVDKAANESSAAVRFAVDTTPPAIQVLGVVDGSFVSADVMPIVQVTDAHLAGWTATVDGAPFVNGVAYVAEGPHAIQVDAWDRAGNEAHSALQVTIDKTPPEVTLDGFSDGDLVNSDVTPSYVATDANLLASSATLDGLAAAPGTVASAEGAHFYEATAIDRAGNRTTRSGSFTIDRTPPLITIAGVTDGQLASGDVTPTVTVMDAHPGSKEITLDGAPFTSGATISTEGDHELRVAAVDGAGNRAEASVRFGIDKTPPEVVIGGVDDGATYDHDVAPTVTISDAHLATSAVTLDGMAYLSGTPVSAEGEHVVTGRGEDHAGWTTERSVYFTIRKSVDVEYTVEKSLLTHLGRVLVLLRSGKCALAAMDVSRVTTFLQAHVAPGHALKIDTDEPTFLSDMRSGAYDVYLLASMGGSDRDCAENGCSKSPEEHVRQAIAWELTEAVNAGRGGVVMVRNRPENLPRYRELLGLDLDGYTSRSRVEFENGSLAPLSTASRAVRMKLYEAQRWASYTGGSKRKCGTGAEVAGGANTLGLGRSIALGFDLFGAVAEVDAAKALEAAIDWVTPAGGDLAPLGVAGVQIRVTNEAADQTTRVREDLAEEISPLATLPPVPLDPPMEWTVPLAGAEERTFRYFARLPDAPGTYRTTTEVAAVLAGGARVFGTYPLDLLVEEDGAGLLADAHATTASISRASNKAFVRQLERLLSGIAARPIRGRADVESNLADLVSAIEVSRKLAPADAFAVRLALDELIRYWEARWYTS